MRYINLLGLVHFGGSDGNGTSIGGVYIRGVGRFCRRSNLEALERKQNPVLPHYKTIPLFGEWILIRRK